MLGNEVVDFRVLCRHLSGWKSENRDNLQLDSLSLEGFEPGSSFRSSGSDIVRVICLGFLNKCGREGGSYDTLCACCV
jgi:hypothetical protein